MGTPVASACNYGILYILHKVLRLQSGLIVLTDQQSDLQYHRQQVHANCRPACGPGCVHISATTLIASLHAYPAPFLNMQVYISIVNAQLQRYAVPKILNVSFENNLSCSVCLAPQHTTKHTKMRTFFAVSSVHGAHTDHPLTTPSEDGNQKPLHGSIQHHHDDDHQTSALHT